MPTAGLIRVVAPFALAREASAASVDAINATFLFFDVKMAPALPAVILFDDRIHRHLLAMFGTALGTGNDAQRFNHG